MTTLLVRLRALLAIAAAVCSSTSCDAPSEPPFAPSFAPETYWLGIPTQLRLFSAVPGRMLGARCVDQRCVIETTDRGTFVVPLESPFTVELEAEEQVPPFRVATHSMRADAAKVSVRLSVGFVVEPQAPLAFLVGAPIQIVAVSDGTKDGLLPRGIEIAAEGPVVEARDTALFPRSPGVWRGHGVTAGTASFRAQGTLVPINDLGTVAFEIAEESDIVEQYLGGLGTSEPEPVLVAERDYSPPRGMSGVAQWKLSILSRLELRSGAVVLAGARYVDLETSVQPELLAEEVPDLLAKGTTHPRGPIWGWSGPRYWRSPPPAGTRVTTMLGRTKRTYPVYGACSTEDCSSVGEGYTCKPHGTSSIFYCGPP